MNITEMHVMFRQAAQQMGLQNVRAILPEQIDMWINASISDIVNQKIKEHIGLTNKADINSKIGQINMFKNLYKRQRLRRHYELGTVYVTNSYVKGTGEFVANLFDSLYIIDANIIYSDNWRRTYPIRIIDEEYFAETINDFILRPTLQSPIITIYNDQFHLYIDKDYDDANNRFIGYNFGIDSVNISYIARPSKVKYSIDYGTPNVDCDLPEYIHVDIVKRAVDMYNISLRSDMYSAQQRDEQRQPQGQQRPVQESYQD